MKHLKDGRGCWDCETASQLRAKSGDNAASKPTQFPSDSAGGSNRHLQRVVRNDVRRVRISSHWKQKISHAACQNLSGDSHVSTCTRSPARKVNPSGDTNCCCGNPWPDIAWGGAEWVGGAWDAACGAAWSPWGA